MGLERNIPARCGLLSSLQNERTRSTHFDTVSCPSAWGLAVAGARLARSSGGMASDGRSRAARRGGRAAWRRASRGRSSRAATWTAGRAEARGRVEDGQRLGVKPWERQRGRRSQARPRSGWSLREPAVGRFGRQQRGTARTQLDLSARGGADDGGTPMPRALKRPDPKIKAKPCINYRIRSPA